MARKRREYQKRLERKAKIARVLGILLFVFAILISVFGIISNAITLQHINDGSLKEYTGSYSYEYKQGYNRGRHSSYRFTLGNGDVITIFARNVRYHDVLDEHSALTVQYDRIPFGKTYRAVSITTPDGEVTIRSLDSSRKSCVAIICFLAIMILLCTPALFAFIVIIPGGWKQRSKKRRKKRSKMRELIDASK